MNVKNITQNNEMKKKSHKTEKWMKKTSHRSVKRSEEHINITEKNIGSVKKIIVSNYQIFRKQNVSLILQ